MARTGGKREKATLTYDMKYYTPIGAKALSESQLRKEYSRLRSIANKRLKRFEGTEWVDTQQYITNVNKYVKLSEIKSDTELRHKLSDVAKFVSAKTGSVSGLVNQRNASIESLHRHGYTFVNKKNFREFVEFMEYTRAAMVGRLYDSKDRAELYHYADSTGMSPDELRKVFRKWNKNMQKKLKRIQNIDPRNSDMFR